MVTPLIIISCFHPLVSRNLLQTGVITRLISNGYRVLILCPEHKEAFFTHTFAHLGVTIRGVKFAPLSRREYLIRQLAEGLLPTSTVRLGRHERFILEPQTFFSRAGYLVFWLMQHTLALWRPLRQRLRHWIKPLWPASQYERLLDDLQPALVFASDVFNHEDTRLLAAARRRGLRTGAMVRSWDNATNKGVLTAAPDRLLVHNEIIKSELAEWHGFDPQCVVVTGLPQFDYYRHYQPRDAREFFRWTGFTPARPVILFAPTGQKFVDDDWYLLQVLAQAVADGRLPGRPQILVRFPPGDTMDLGRALIPDEVAVYIDRPGVAMAGERLKDREMDQKEMERLADSLYFSHLLVSVGSTLCIDIAAFGKPVICPRLAVEGMPYYRSMVKMYDKYHYRYLFQEGGCLLAQTVSEYLQLVQRALELIHPNQQAQRQFLEAQCYRFDGASSERVAQAIGDMLQ